MNLEEFGKVWIASSPLTSNMDHIKKSIKAGADTIILKSATSLDAVIPPKGIRKISVHKLVEFNYGFVIPMQDSLHTTSTARDCEMLSIKESNNLFREIKKYSSGTKVIANFAPITPDYFMLVNNLEGDAIEISQRWYDLKISKPYFIIMDANPKFDLKANSSMRWRNSDISKTIDHVVTEAKKYQLGLKEKEHAFRDGMNSIYGQRPILLKLCRQFFEMNLSVYEAMTCDGFTFSDSTKGGLITQLAGVQVDIFGKGSMCGSTLTDETIAYIKHFRKRNTHYISASGGILNADNAQQAISNGAGSVQLCTAIYLYGYDSIKEIANKLK